MLCQQEDVLPHIVTILRVFSERNVFTASTSNVSISSITTSQMSDIVSTTPPPTTTTATNNTNTDRLTNNTCINTSNYRLENKVKASVLSLLATLLATTTLHRLMTAQVPISLWLVLPLLIDNEVS